MTSKIVFEVIRLQLHTMTYPREKKYKNRCTVQKESSEYSER